MIASAWRRRKYPLSVPRRDFIRTRAVGVHHCDTDVRRGVFGVAQTFPHVMGVDSAGEVAAVGTCVQGFAEGDRVSPHFLLSCGSCRNCIEGKEEHLPHRRRARGHDLGHLCGVREGAGAQCGALAGEHFLRRRGGGPDPVRHSVGSADRGRPTRRGETVLVNAAGSGVGSAGIQIAKLAGAMVIATTGADDKFAAARALGADAVVNYEKTTVAEVVMALTGGLGVDLAFDMVGGSRLLDSIAALALGGRIVSVGAHGGEHVDIDMIELFRKHISLHGCGRSTKATATKVLDLVAAGRLKPVIFKAFDLEQAGEAHRVMESRNFFGRMLMHPWGNA